MTTMKTIITNSIINNSNLGLFLEMSFLCPVYLNRKSYFSFGEAGNRNNGVRSSVITTLIPILKKHTTCWRDLLLVIDDNYELLFTFQLRNNITFMLIKFPMFGRHLLKNVRIF
jgi:hypothetical protein